MTGKTAGRKENKHILQQVSPVTSKCLGMVVSTIVEANAMSGKEIFDDFQLRNSTCYWNSALSESIRNLQYLGFLEPRTVLVGGNDVCLDNLRMAWGRRVLNDPHNCRIEKIGDIGHIMMQEVPQNHFIPLPEILCLIILDLNNKQILATVDIIQAQLKKCYQGTQLPSNQLVYETLHSLIQDRKLFHTGSGYFVVTPDTLHLPVDLPSPRIPLQHNPMYLPVSHMTLPAQNQNFPVDSNASSPMTTVAMTQTLPPVRSISCQVSLANQKRASTPEIKLQENDKPRLNRSHSARRYKDKEKSQKVDETVKKNVSVRAKDDCLTSRDVNIMKSNLNKVKEKGEKKSLLSKLFGKKKKVEEAKLPAKVKKPDVEYATFSAQFPPPEWKWYQEQCKKQERTKDWVSQQTGKPIMSHGTHKVHRYTPEKRQDGVQTTGNFPVTLPTVASSSGHHKPHKHRTSDKLYTYHEIESYRPCNRTKPQCVQDTPQEVKFKPIQNPHDKDIENRVRRTKSHHRKTNRHSMDVELLRRPHIQREQQQQQNMAGLSPMYSSTPRDCDRICTKLGAVETVNVCSSPIFHEVDRTNREHRSRKRRSKHYKRIDNDITCENVGRLPHKHSNVAMSRDSGVNCVGLSNPTENNNVFCYNQFIDDGHYKSNNLRKSMENNTLHQSESHKNEIVCVAEINTCVQQHDSIMDTDRIAQNQSSPVQINYQVVEKSSDLSKSEFMDSSEQSYDTVIYNKRLQDVSRETENMTLGDSGFHSPRLAELELDKNRNKMKVPIYKNLVYDHNDLNNMQTEKIVLNNEFYKEPSPSSDYQVVGVV